MEGGQKNKISLESGLDINSSDMLVPVVQPTFQHNWQKFQGKCLPNSLRFEKNGWAAGWNVFNFEYNMSRVQVGPYWAGATQLNNNPTYNLGLYDSESSANALITFTVTPTSRITNVIGQGTARLEGNNIVGNVNGKNYTIVWNPETETCTLNATNVDMEWVQNKDKSYTFIIKDMTESVTVDNTIHLPGVLKSPSLTMNESYTGYNAGVHSWGTITYNSNTNIANVIGGTGVTPTVSDDNKITFSATGIDNNFLNIAWALTDWVLEFDKMTFKSGGTTEHLTICNEATPNAAQNLWTGVLSDSNMRGRDEEWTQIDFRATCYLSAKVGSKIDTSAGAKEANNVTKANLKFSRISLTNTQYKLPATAVYHVENTYTGQIVDLETDLRAHTLSELDTVGSVPLRYNRITLDNGLSCKSSEWDIRKHLIKTDTYAGNLKQWEVFRSAEKNAESKRMLGHYVQVLTGKWDPTTKFAYNKWDNWADKENAVYTETDIGNARSIKVIGEADEYDINNTDEDIVLDNELTEDEIRACAVNIPNEAGIHIFADTDQTYYIGDIFDVAGNYLLNSYADFDMEPNLFKYIPEFNYRLTTDAALDAANAAYNTALADFNVKLATYNGVRQARVDAEQAVVNAEGIVRNAERAVQNAERGVQNAEQAVQNAQAALDEAIASGGDVAAAQAALDAANTALGVANTALTNAEDTLDDTEAALSTARAAVPATQIAEQDAERELDTVRIVLNSTQDELTWQQELYTTKHAYGRKANGDFLTTDMAAAEYLMGTSITGIPMDNEILEDNISYNTKRYILQAPKVLFDFPWSNYQDENNKNTQEFMQLWTEWYPGKANPASMSNEPDTYSTYTDYVNTEFADDCAMNIGLGCSRPGVNVFSVSGIDYALSAPNNKGIVPWKNATREYNMYVYHNKVDVTNLYDITTDIKPGSLQVGTTGSPTEIYYPLDFFDNKLGGIPCSQANTTTYSNVNGIAHPGEVNATARANSPTCWADSIGVSTEDVGGIIYLMPYSYKIEVIHHDGQGSASGSTPPWDEYRKVVDANIRLADGIETAKKTKTLWGRIQTQVDLPMTLTNKNVPDGIVYSQPLWGHVAMRMKYKDFFKKNDLAQALQEGRAIEIEKVPDDELPDADNLYIDRNTTKHSYNWYEFNLNAISFLASESNISCDLKATGSDSVMYYVPQIQKEGSNPPKEIENYDATNDKIFLYPPVVGTMGYMKEATSPVCAAKIAFNPVEIKIPESGLCTLEDRAAKSKHIFYSEGIDKLTGAEINLGDGLDNFDFDTNTLPFKIDINGMQVDGVYQANTTITATLPANDTNFTDAEVTYSIGAGLLDKVKIPLLIQLEYRDCEATFCKSEVDTLVSWDKGLLKLQAGAVGYNYNAMSQSVIGFKTDVTTIDDNSIHILAEKVTKVHCSAVLSNVVDNHFSFTYKGVEYTVGTEVLLSGDNSVSIASTDIRSPYKTSIIGKIDMSKEYQIVKQQWNSTVDVADFWWIDDTHILELDDYNWTLKRKTDDLDDWNGDRWEKIYEIPRTGILISSVLRYMVTNTYNTAQGALLLVFSVENDKSVKVDIYDPMDEMQLKGKVYLEIAFHEIGTELNADTGSGFTARLNTYAVISASQLINQATWSSTITDGKLMIGCHHSNNFRQWTAIFNSETLALESCIQGYGYVGVNGSLTGGQLPKKYFSGNKGFNGTVEPLSVLSKVEEGSANADAKYILNDTSKLNEIIDRVVGTAERQWYLSKTISGIVSHLEYDAGIHSHVTRIIPITNKFDAIYKSPSFYSKMIGDLTVCAYSFADAFNFPTAGQAIWSTFVGLIGWPMLYALQPRLASLGYLQQTLGQYAYVHYNSSESMEKSGGEAGNTAGKNGMDTELSTAKGPVLSDDYTFDKQIVRQEVNLATGVWRFAEMLFMAFAPALEHIQSSIAVNTETNQTATSDVGKKYSQMAMENLGGLATNALMTESRDDQGLTSQVVGMKSIDMFYSTSDKQKVYAGPGFVEHQFVADCVAQSVTDVQAEGSVQQIVYIIRALTALQMQTQIALLEAGADALAQSLDGLDGVMICANAPGGALMAAAKVAAGAMKTGAQAQRIAAEQLEGILDTMCARGITSEKAAGVSRHALTTEGKHKYGEKNEEFMWPCWGVPSGGLEYTDEVVNATIKESGWMCNLMATKFWSRLVGSITVPITGIFSGEFVAHSSIVASDRSFRSIWNLNTELPFYQASCYGSSTKEMLPEDMACVQGVPTFLPNQAFKNENIGVSDPAFAPSLFQDYIIDKSWELSQTCTYGLQQWVTVKDTKITSCPPSNMRISTDFCGIATPYAAIEVKRGLSKQYMRPWAITPNVLAFNCTGYNSILENELYHSFDGLSYRIVEWTGAPGLNKNNQTFLYAFQVNDRFKRSNKFPANELQGAFNSEPIQAVDTLDKLWTQVTVAAKEQGMEGGTIGEDKDTTRWAIPIFTEPVTLLPAAVKTLTAMPLIVYDGVTSLTTDIANNQTAYKAPLSVDFTIGKNVYRQTAEYICSVETTEGLDIVTDLVPSLGLTFIGSTPTEAYFYSKATRCYYSFTGGSTLTKMDMMERFRDIKSGHWDFVNQEVVMPCLMTFKRLNAEVEDKDTETDNIIVPVLSKNQVSGELIPPITTIFNDRSWYKVVSLPSGLTYQGPNRVIINRNVFVEYMTDSIKGNYGKWKRMDREKYVSKREYPEVYDRVDTDVQGVDGWTHNPFLLVTSAMGIDESIDNLYEWEITFCWPIEMDLLYGVDNYAVVNITAETMTPGGKVKSRPTHVYLTKELFTRSGNYGYYSFRYQSKNGAGNRERLHIWSDQYIAISSLTCESKQITNRRNEILTQQIDVQNLKEL